MLSTWPTLRLAFQPYLKIRYVIIKNNVSTQQVNARPQNPV
jgi:hypothetical protein